MQGCAWKTFHRVEISFTEVREAGEKSLTKSLHQVIIFLQFLGKVNQIILEKY